MRRRTIKSVLVLVVSHLFICLSGGYAWSADSLSKTQLDLVAGLRVDKLKWSIAGNTAGKNPNILSELSWDNLQILQIKHIGVTDLSFNDLTNTAVRFSWQVGYGQIISGRNQDSDYGGDNRNLEWSRSNNDAGDGQVLDLSFGVGFHRLVESYEFSVNPQIGYSIHLQNLTIFNGYQSLSDQSIADSIYGPGAVSVPPVGPISSLASTYDAKWNGPWIGLDIEKKISPYFEIGTGIELHRTNYNADANWNLRTDLAHPVSFSHKGDGYGLVLNFDINIAIKRNFHLTLSGNYQDWRVDSGYDTIYFANGMISKTKLQEVEWGSYAISGGLTYRF